MTRNSFPARNYLKGMQCPRCGNKKSLFVEVTVLGTLTDDDFEIAEGGGALNFKDLSRCVCEDCGLGGLVGHVALFTESHAAFERYKKDEVQLLPFVFTGTYDADFNETAEIYESDVVWAEKPEHVPSLESKREGWDFCLEEEPFTVWEVIRADTKKPVYSKRDYDEELEHGE